jgi:hypothetical protein
VKYIFLFSGGPLDGSGMWGDDDEYFASNDQAARAYGSTQGGTIGKQFEVENPNTPADEKGVVWRFRRHIYEVTDTEKSESGKLLIHAKHVQAVE